MSTSIVQKNKECLVCGSPFVVKHHIFEGTANRKKSEEYGLWCWLCGTHHNGSNKGVHFNPALDTALKQLGQMEFEKLYGHEKFMDVFHHNSL